MLTLGNKIIAGSFKAGASWEVGDVGISAFGIDEALNKRRYLNGQVISQAQFVEFTAMLKSRVSVYPNLATTEVNWQAAVTNSALGQCGKFVIDDDAGTIRLPKVVNLQGLMDLTHLGTTVEAGLPNITGRFDGIVNNTPTGAFKDSGILYEGPGSSYTRNQIDFDASDSNSIYGNSTTVQPEAVQYPYFIQVAEGIETSVDVSREIELNNPFSLLDYKYSEYELSNASWLRSNGQWNSGSTYADVYDLLLEIYNGTVTKAGVSVKLSTETYTDTDFVLNTGDTTFRLPLYTQRVLVAKGSSGTDWWELYSDGWCEQGGEINGNNNTYTTVTMTKTFVDTNYNIIATQQSSSATYPNTSIIGYYNKQTSSFGLGARYVASNETPTAISWRACGYASVPSISDYTEIKGLYFYVGETVQDANIIAAASVLTKVANSIDRTVESDRETVVGWGMPDYTAGISITYNQVFHPTTDGCIILESEGVNNTQFAMVECYSSLQDAEARTNKTILARAVVNTHNAFVIPCDVSASDYIVVKNNNNQGIGGTFYPCKGEN